MDSDSPDPTRPGSAFTSFLPFLISLLVSFGHSRRTPCPSGLLFRDMIILLYRMYVCMHHLP